MEARRRALRRQVAAAVSIVVASALAGGCTGSSRPISGRVAVPVSWEHVALPSDPRGATMVRAVGACAAGWYAAGAVVDKNRGNHPALWFSSDGTSWSAITVKPISVYGLQNILYSVACNSSSVVVVGAAVGGAHGNPRTSTWYGAVGGGTLTEARATFETYGGPDAVGVGRVAAGPSGFLIVGGRVNANNVVGAAVWRSTDGKSFQLIDDDPALESGAAGGTEVHGGLVDSAQWIAVGALTPPTSTRGARDPAVWTSPDGVMWQLIKLPASPADNILEQIIATDDGVLALGADGTGFSAWTASGSAGPNAGGPDSGWHRTSHFGDHGPATSLPRVLGIALGSGGHAVYTAVFDGHAYGVWKGGADGDGWASVDLPDGASEVTGIVGSGAGVLIAVSTSDGASQLFLARA